MQHTCTVYNFYSTTLVVSPHSIDAKLSSFKSHLSLTLNWRTLWLSFVKLLDDLVDSTGSQSLGPDTFSDYHVYLPAVQGTQKLQIFYMEALCSPNHRRDWIPGLNSSGFTFPELRNYYVSMTEWWDLLDVHSCINDYCSDSLWARCVFDCDNTFIQVDVVFVKYWFVFLVTSVVMNRDVC